MQAKSGRLWHLISIAQCTTQHKILMIYPLASDPKHWRMPEFLEVQSMRVKIRSLWDHIAQCIRRLKFQTINCTFMQEPEHRYSNLLFCLHSEVNVPIYQLHFVRSTTIYDAALRKVLVARSTARLSHSMIPTLTFSQSCPECAHNHRTNMTEAEIKCICFQG